LSSTSVGSKISKMAREKKDGGVGGGPRKEVIYLIKEF
jgi:hypothetical protein